MKKIILVGKNLCYIEPITYCLCVAARVIFNKYQMTFCLISEGLSFGILYQPRNFPVAFGESQLSEFTVLRLRFRH